MLWRNTHALQAMGQSQLGAHDAAMGLINQTLDQQAAILAYTDLYAYMAVAAFCIVPLTLLFRSGIAGRPR